MLKYKLNASHSRELYEKYKEHIEPKMCYNNIFHVFEYNVDKIRNGEWKIAYGYVSSVNNVLCRHCFIIDEYGNALDPTIFTQTEVNTDREYFSFKTYDDVAEYLDAIEENKLYVALERVLRAEERQAHEWALDNGYLLIG